jgi:hypothetical protein
MDWLRLIGEFVLRLLAWWKSREDAAKAAEAEQAAEIAAHDRAKANQLRDTVDRARLGGGLQHRADDDRGYRRD